MDISGTNPYSYIKDEIWQSADQADLAPITAGRDPAKVSQQFSALFVGLLLKKALDSSWSQAQDQDPDQPKPIYSRDKEIYRDMLYQQLVSQLVEDDAFGLREALTGKNLIGQGQDR